MTAIDPTSLPPSVLREALLAGARGLYEQEAAVQLLIAHDVWLRRGDFLTRCVRVDDAGWTPDGTTTLAVIRWAVAQLLAGDGPASASEAAVLFLAAALADGDLGTAISRLDQANFGLVLDAIAHSAGWHEHGISRLVTGGVV